MKLSYITHAGVFLLGIIIGALLFKGCGVKPCPDVQTVTKTDTVTVYSQPERSETHTNIHPVNEERVKPVGRVDPLHAAQSGRQQPGDTAHLGSETSAIVEDYWIRRNYSDTFRFASGRVIVRNSVLNNKLEKQDAVLDSVKQITITNTVTRTIMQPRRIKGYLTAAVYGNPTDLITGYGGGFMLQFKNDHALEANLIRLRTGSINYGLSYKYKLSFH